MEILINHIGYDTGSSKKAIIKDRRGSGSPERALNFLVVQSESGKPVFSGKARFIGSVAGWKDWVFWSLDFSGLTETGRFAIEIPGVPQSAIRSEPFEVEEDLLLDSMNSEDSHA